MIALVLLMACSGMVPWSSGTSARAPSGEVVEPPAPVPAPVPAPESDAVPLPAPAPAPALENSAPVAPAPPASPTSRASAAARRLTDAERTAIAGPGGSWRPGCPVEIEALRWVTVRFIGPDGAPKDGALVAHHQAVDALVRAFEAIYAAGFPLTSVQPIEAFGGQDAASMAADNTSVFNCRQYGKDTDWSQHAFGSAVDINPVKNPHVTATRVRPPAGQAFLDRGGDVPGLIRDGDPVVRAFYAVGWRWGGRWRSAKDYQHFSASGR
jgi:hypothetical protein